MQKKNPQTAFVVSRKKNERENKTESKLLEIEL